LDFDSGEVGPTNHTIETLGGHTPAMPRMSLRNYQTTNVCNCKFQNRV